MSLSLKAELETWAAALKAYDEQDFEGALDLFSRMADSSKILTNMGLIYATIGAHETAIEHFVSATNLDAYLSIAHFQCGVSNFLLERYDLALLNFEDAHLYLRGNQAINYEQIGLKFKLFSAEIMFNKGLTQLNLGYPEAGMADMQEASTQKVTDEHSVIDEAIRDHGQGYTVFSIPVGVVYRPSERKLKNSKSKDYLGKAKLVAARDSNDAFTEFTGVKRLRQASGDNTDGKEGEDKPVSESPTLSRSATAPTPRTDPLVARPPILERSNTALQVAAGVRPDLAAILASRRSKSVSNPANVPPPASELSRATSALGRSDTTRLTRSATNSAGIAMPPRVKTPLGTAGGIAGVGAGNSRAGGETGNTASGALTNRRPSLRRLQAQGTPQVVHQAPPVPLQPGQYVNAPQGANHFVLPAVPAPAQGEGHITQFYDTYLDAYTDDFVSSSAFPRPPTSQAWSSPSSSQRQSPAASFYSQSPPQPQEQRQLPAWMQSSPSSVRTSSNTSSSSGPSNAPSRTASAGMMNTNPNMFTSMNMEQNMGMNQNITMGKGGIINTGGGTLRRKLTHRPMGRRVTVYDDEEGDDGFVTGEIDEFEMANIRVKLHYQSDVRGMTIPLTTSFNEFVERVTAKFGTSLMGLGMKFMDEEGTKISLRDESDFELAIETARENAKGRSEGKIEVWCVNR